MRICPGSDVMKAKYECYVYNVEEVESAIGTKIRNLYGLYVASTCTKGRSEQTIPDQSLPRPDGGFSNTEYQCQVRDKK